MDENPYQPPAEANADRTSARQRPSVRRVLGGLSAGCFIWAFGGFFVAVMISFAFLACIDRASGHAAEDWMAFRRTAADAVDLVFLPIVFAAGFGVFWAAHSTIALIRIAAWATAGLGLGLVISHGTSIPHDLSLVPPLVFGLVLSIVGYLSPLRHPVRDRRGVKDDKSPGDNLR